VGDRDATWRWVIDPIDGTRSFVRGNETWATLIALQRDGESVVGVASARPCDSASTRPSAAAHTSMDGKSTCRRSRRSRGADHPHRDPWLRHHQPGRETRRARRALLGCARCGQLHVAPRRRAGTADIGWTSRANLWDYAALKLVVTEAGGRFTDRSGDDPCAVARGSHPTVCSTTRCSRRPGTRPARTS